MSEERKLTFLADSFFAFKLTESEQVRIAQLAESNGTPAHLIRTYAPSTKPYQDVYQKKDAYPADSGRVHQPLINKRRRAS